MNFTVFKNYKRSPTVINSNSNVRLQMKRNGGETYDLHVTVIIAALGLVMCFRDIQALSSMELMYTWGTPTFVFQSDQQRQQLEANGTYIPGNSVPFDVDIGGLNRSVFITMPWMLDGSPVTLATIQNSEQRDSPQLVPYPDWSWHAGARGCDGLTSVFRIKADGCGRLWVVDSGVADVANSFRRQCPAQLLVFNLTTNELLVRHHFQSPEASCLESLVLNVAVEQMGDSCSNDTYAYVADTLGFALYVYSLRTNSSWRVPGDLFFPDVNARRFRVADTSFALMDGVLALALSPARRGDRLLLFHATSSAQEGAVRTSVLRNRTLFAGGANGAPDAFRFIGWRKCQAAGEAMTSNGVLFFSPLCTNSIVCWNSRRDYNRRNHVVVERDARLLRFVGSVKVLPAADGRGEEVWAVANNGQLLFAGEYRSNVTNSVNIVRGCVRDLLAGTFC